MAFEWWVAGHVYNVSSITDHFPTLEESIFLGAIDDSHDNCCMYSNRSDEAHLPYEAFSAVTLHQFIPQNSISKLWKILFFPFLFQYFFCLKVVFLKYVKLNENRDAYYDITMFMLRCLLRHGSIPAFFEKETQGVTFFNFWFKNFLVTH